jgi:glyoxylase-like metal-dependent hydrolase (beta-lactamase superfamily II)
MTAYVCSTCGQQFTPSEQPPPSCPVCEDERQYVGLGGQRWTTAQELAADHEHRFEEVEPGLTGVGVDPHFAIGQRALVTGNLMWDCVPMLDAAAAERIAGVDTIAISHPHYYTGMVDWADALDARILLHEDDREWIMRPDDRIELWSGERRTVSDDLELIRLGGHFAGGTVCLWRSGAEGRGALLSGDIVQVIPDRNWVSFMWSFPNLIPLPAREIARIKGVLETLEFDRIHGAWWGRLVDGDARAKALRSADRYIAAIT